MPNPETIAIKSGDSFALINKADFNPDLHQLYEGVETRPADTVSDFVKNPTGTFSTPTPTDIRYPDQNMTEFENNHGAHIARNAGEIRQVAELPDAPGGIYPDPKLEEAAKAAAEAPTVMTDDPAVDDETTFARPEASGNPEAAAAQAEGGGAPSTEGAKITEPKPKPTPKK